MGKGWAGSSLGGPATWTLPWAEAWGSERDLQRLPVQVKWGWGSLGCWGLPHSLVAVLQGPQTAGPSLQQAFHQQQYWVQGSPPVAASIHLPGHLTKWQEHQGRTTAKTLGTVRCAAKSKGM